ncbi:M2 family metallopeptidase [Paucibacter sp. APW11]|uniref:M2 family metallopeptidase n=1 Tax=Roseateles aquae TaxID=3077235 RepID=A0ABU3P9L2_9BURK|nr:M2 family metallopeptidase [Paucibacter sp. APW11]MDT8999242.1 M2 family metallopeptidase [Paucibacter sp. APW11]
MTSLCHLPRVRRTFTAAAATLLVLLCIQPAQAATAASTTQRTRAFIADAEARLEKLGIQAQRAQWVADTFITDDTELITAQAGEQLAKVAGELALAARRLSSKGLSPAEARKLEALRHSAYLASDAERERLALLQAKLNGAYGKAKYCPPAKAGQTVECQDLAALEKILAESRDPAQLLDAWAGWHSQSRAYKADYAEYIALANKAARTMGFADNGAFWRSGYDMPEAAFAADMERVWQQVRPLYDSLHLYARYKLRQAYGHEVVPASGPIPAHLFGNMWSQSWENLYPLLKPSTPGGDYELSRVLAERKPSPEQMVRIGEGFYTSLGLEALPASFWTRSVFSKTTDHEMVCHASAWDIDTQEDVRIKMCIRPNDEDFNTIHHELGHVYYDLAYRKQPKLFREGANDGFHEAIGDTVALSITPAYLQQLGLMRPEDDSGDDTGALLMQALRKVSFLPFAYLVDNWRWQVYAGKVAPNDYDRVWWQLREQVQGVRRPLPAEAGGFDAGAKYHVASDTSYARYFLAHILQFQFHRALCREAGQTGPLHRCSIYGSKAAGAKFQAMLSLGASKPWSDALQQLSGERRLDASALTEYFAPLQAWLAAQNKLLGAADPAVLP